ncbi:MULTISPECIES: thiol-disulfide oxidoreductase DCC family protein [Kitasatospora]|uniref:DCC family thiol-disulfide oxidoreductase YuxK n=2 Tax=Kitasatospora TaxID=2063 RepID=A0ABT1IUP1_9ACTN|nr:DUF393 domain-containing protein [Kitasatospora paracochleata]MCP2308842.1 putative DCC family thiol-disulfide oxidoreductase YuxK [Kitasatospora paracochleata]MCP2308855.1 putative DCC family thiol-disulfide oxidoreductase YuxK [Kitasatospora paracochleata]MCP2308865.1 putative DCC family thiol-disulfide oxidoreductase YuxK [Kitasatospora paracochleata]
MADDISRDPVLVYDGDCAFCTTCVRWAERYPRASLSSAGWDAVPFQRADLAGLDAFTGGRGQVTRQRAERELLWITPSRRVYGGAQAAARLLLRSGGAWAWAGALLTLPPVRPLAEAVYRTVARHRHQLPGGTPACELR